MLIDHVSESFKRNVRDCLVHLYDIAVLQANPLAMQIAPDLAGLPRVQQVRRVIIEAIEQLRSRETAGVPSRQGRVYSLLLLRYVEGLPTQEVLQQLALSERQFYREHHRAIETVSQLLWDHVNASQSRDGAISVKSEIQRLSRQSSYATIDVEALLSEVIVANGNLADRHQVTVHLRPSLTIGDLVVHQAVVRQTVISILSQVITHAAPGSSVAVSATSVDHDAVIRFEISGPDAKIVKLRETLTTSTTVAEFLAILNGAITITQTDRTRYAVEFQLKPQRQVILVIDDNPDVVALLERYVTSTPYEIVSAGDADEGFRLAQNLDPSWIILDIMLPNTDGWKLLQTLRSHPQTQSIPVLVCSVLENPDLALSLGANAYLRKPPDRLSFLESLQDWAASEH